MVLITVFDLIQKSVCFKVGHDWLKSVAHVYLGNMMVEWVDRIKYLGIMFSAGSAMRVDTTLCLKKPTLMLQAISSTHINQFCSFWQTCR